MGSLLGVAGVKVDSADESRRVTIDGEPQQCHKEKGGGQHWHGHLTASLRYLSIEIHSEPLFIERHGRDEEA